MSAEASSGPQRGVSVRVLYADTDMAGVVYHGTYLRFLEAARTAWLYDTGCDVAQLQRDEGIVFAITHAALSYHRPARYGDLLDIETFPVKVKPARLTLGYTVTVRGAAEPCVTAETTFAAVSLATGRGVRLPDAIRQQAETALD